MNIKYKYPQVFLIIQWSACRITALFTVKLQFCSARHFFFFLMNKKKKINNHAESNTKSTGKHYFKFNMKIHLIQYHLSFSKIN